MPPFATVWQDLLAPLILAVAGGAIAAAWPWLQTYSRRMKFEGVIRRELEEVWPFPAEPTLNTPWWEHLRKRYVHEEVFARNRIAENRDFLLSLHPDVIYKVSQLWIAFEKRDAEQWLYFLGELGVDANVGSPQLRCAHQAWCKLLSDDRVVTTKPRARDDGCSGSPELVQARMQTYTALYALSRFGPEDAPLTLSASECAVRAEKLLDWFYAGGGLVLSGEAFVAFRRAQKRLMQHDATDAARWHAFSALRTELKIDVGVRHADVRAIPLAEVPPDE
jgi:hypothetical protein